MTKQSEITNNFNYLPILNEGFVGLVDHMGNDDAIVQAARVSYGKGTKKVSEDKGLIRYLMRHKHTSPFEMVEFKFHAKMPIFVARQWVRHRTASINEYSGRYSEMSEDMFIPELSTIKPQSKDNKQGRNGDFTVEERQKIQERIIRNNDLDQDEYQILLNTDLAKEMARGVLSVNNYTEWYWKTDLHNLFHFLRLRMDAHAQYEIRVYAEAMHKLVQPIVPIACEAFDDYILNGTNISKQEIAMLKEIVSRYFKYSENATAHEIEATMKANGVSQREILEFMDKFGI